MSLRRLLGVLLLLGLLWPADALAQRGGSSSSSGGGRGGSSSGFSGGSSSGVRSGGSSWSGGSSSGTKAGSGSGWGGGSSTPKAPASSGGSSSGRSGWGGGSSPPKAPPGGTGGNPGQSSGGGSSGWSGGSSGSKTVTTTTPKAGSTPKSVSQKPAAESFDKVAVADAKKAESRVNYEKANAPAASYKTPKGTEAKIDPKDKEVAYLRGRLDESKWVNRTQRTTVFYGGYVGPSYPVMVYADPYHGLFNYWLLSQSMDTMAMWVYCHEHSMDRARINDLYARNAQLEAQVAALRARGVKPDPAWMPQGADPDLLYNDDYVNGVYNPHPKTVTQYEYDDEDGPSGWAVFGIVVLVLFVMTVVGLAVYYLFFHRF